MVIEMEHRNDLIKPQSNLVMVFVPILLFLMFGGGAVMGVVQDIIGLTIICGIIAALVLLLVVAMITQHISQVKKFKMLLDTLNVVQVVVEEIKEDTQMINHKRVISGYFAVAHYDGRRVTSYVYKRGESDVKVGDKINLYLPEEGLKEGRLEPCYDYYLDVFNI